MPMPGAATAWDPLDAISENTHGRITKPDSGHGMVGMGFRSCPRCNTFGFVKAQYNSIYMYVFSTMAQVARGERERKKFIKFYFDIYPTLQIFLKFTNFCKFEYFRSQYSFNFDDRPYLDMSFFVRFNECYRTYMAD